MSDLPAGYHTVTPSLSVRDAAAALDFYAKAFGATEFFRLPDPSGKVMHAEFDIGDSRLMISDEFPEYGAVAPAVGAGGLFMIYVPDVDAAHATAVEAGAISVQPPTDMFWGDRSAKVNDPFGYRWTLATRIREVTPEEMEEATKAWLASQDAEA